MSYPVELVLRVNEIFHDLEGRDYQDRHPEIFHDEAARWQQIGRRFLSTPRERSLRMLDIGSGTGFVPLQLGPFLNEGDQITCSDLSARMLAVCRTNLAAAGLKCRCDYVKLDGRTIGVDDAACDVVTMNSVLHHIPDLAGFAVEICRVLRPGGLLVIGHEPNKAFYDRPLLRLQSRLWGAAFTPRQTAGAALRAIGVMGLVKRVLRRLSPSAAGQGAMLDQVNARLREERLIQTPLTADQLTEIVDIHSPTAGGFHPGRGIDPVQLPCEHFAGFTIEHLETYNHLGDHTSTRNRLTHWWSNRLSRRLPTAGATFMTVYRAPLVQALNDPRA